MRCPRVSWKIQITESWSITKPSVGHQPRSPPLPQSRREDVTEGCRPRVAARINHEDILRSNCLNGQPLDIRIVIIINPEILARWYVAKGKRIAY